MGLYYLRWGLVVFLLLVSKATWVPKVEVAGVSPDLLLGVVFLLALRRGTTWGAWSGVVLGLLVDVEQPTHLGLESLALGLAGFAAGRWAGSLDRTNPLVLVILLFLAGLISESVRVTWLALTQQTSVLMLWLRWALPGAVYTTLLLPPLLWAASRVMGRRHWISGAA